MRFQLKPRYIDSFSQLCENLSAQEEVLYLKKRKDHVAFIAQYAQRFCRKLQNFVKVFISKKGFLKFSSDFLFLAPLPKSKRN